MQKHHGKCNGVHSLQCPTCHKHFKSYNGRYYHIKNVKCQPIVQNIHNDHSVTNTTNNIDNSVNHNITNTITVNLVHFGNENIQHLLEDTTFMDLVLKAAADATTPEAKAKVVPMLAERIHFDPKHPENQTIKLSTQRGMYHAKVHTAKGWERTPWEEAIDSMNIKANTCLHEHAGGDDAHLSMGYQEYFWSLVEDEGVQKKQRVATRDKVLDALGA